LQNATNVRQHIIIPKSQHAITELLQKFVADLVPQRFRVLSAIDFNDDFLLSTDKVADLATDWFLSNELVSTKLTTS